MRTICITVAVVIVTFTARSSTADTHALNRITVRTYDSAALTEADRARAVEVAHAILAAAGIDVLWVRCGAEGSGRPGGPCLGPLTSNELAVRFVSQPPPAPTSPSNEVALGYSLIDKRTNLAALATLYLEPVTRLASTCNVTWTTVLGRAVAHEIGHLLLGTSDHEPAGLMRALWTRQILERNRDDDFRFTVADSRALRAAVSARNTSNAPAQIVWSTE